MSVPRRGAAPIATGSSPGGCSANALDITTAERVRAPPQQLLMVAKCSVMVGGHQVSSRRLLGRPGPKSGSAGSRWRPQHTRNSRAARAMTPVLQDKPRHQIDLAARIPAIYFALHWPIVALFTRIRNISCHRIVAAALHCIIIFFLMGKVLIARETNVRRQTHLLCL